MSYMYHIYPQSVIVTLTVTEALNVSNEPTMIVRLHLGVVVTRLVVGIIAMTRIAQSNWPIGNNNKNIIGNQKPTIAVYDDSIALLFGNGTTIGQVCSYSKGLEEEVVENVPGFCCMDAPYEANDWGENGQNYTALIDRTKLHNN